MLMQVSDLRDQMAAMENALATGAASTSGLPDGEADELRQELSRVTSQLDNTMAALKVRKAQECVCSCLNTGFSACLLAFRLPVVMHYLVSTYEEAGDLPAYLRNGVDSVVG